ncbi:MAG: heavy-metal-associated domain-containing protein [Magnetovibrionaceae bacterium]
MTDTYRVEGMTCDGCAKSVTRALTEQAGAASVEVDLEAKTVSVTGIDAEAVKGAIEGAGFDFLGSATES